MHRLRYGGGPRWGLQGRRAAVHGRAGDGRRRLLGRVPGALHRRVRERLLFLRRHAALHQRAERLYGSQRRLRGRPGLHRAPEFGGRGAAAGGSTAALALAAAAAFPFASAAALAFASAAAFPFASAAALALAAAAAAPALAAATPS